MPNSLARSGPLSHAGARRAQLSVYDDRLVLWNPGMLPEQWTLEHLLTIPYPEAAPREALLNAAVHKDYATGIPRCGAARCGAGVVARRACGAVGDRRAGGRANASNVARVARGG